MKYICNYNWKLIHDIETLDAFRTQLEFSIYLQTKGLKIVDKNAQILDADEMAISTEHYNQIASDLKTLGEEVQLLLVKVDKLQQNEIKLKEEMQATEQKLKEENDILKASYVATEGKVITMVEKLRDEIHAQF